MAAGRIWVPLLPPPSSISSKTHMTQSSLFGRCLVSFAFTSLLVALVPDAGSAQTHSDPELVLRPGDALRITVWQMPELSADEVLIGDDGLLFHPFYRDVRVAGMGVDQIKSRLTERLRQVQATPEFVVRPLVRITVYGWVNRSDVFRHPPETSIADAVAMAGGVSDRGDDKHVRLIRGGKVVDLNLRDPLGPATRIKIRSGDEIVVGRRGAGFAQFIVPVVSLIAAAASVANLVR